MKYKIRKVDNTYTTLQAAGGYLLAESVLTYQNSIYFLMVFVSFLIIFNIYLHSFCLFYHHLRYVFRFIIYKLYIRNLVSPWGIFSTIILVYRSTESSREAGGYLLAKRAWEAGGYLLTERFREGGVATCWPRALGQQVALCLPRALGMQVATGGYLESCQAAGGHLLAESSREASPRALGKHRRELSGSR